MLSRVDFEYESRSTNDTRRSEDTFRFQSRSFTSRKAPISFVMPVIPSVRMRQSGPHWIDVREILYWRLVYDNVREKRSKFV